MVRGMVIGVVAVIAAVSLVWFVMYAYAAAPTITVTVTNNTGDAPTVSAADDDSGTTTWKYKYIDNGTTCDSSAMSSGTTSYTEGASLTVLSANSTKKICFSSTNDETTPETGYAASAQLTVGSALTATVGTPSPSGSAQAKTVGLSSVTTGATVKYNMITSSTCNATNYGSGGTSVTISSGSGTATITDESDNEKYACFQVTKQYFTTKYFGSVQIAGIDDTAPTVTYIPGHEGGSVSGSNVELNPGNKLLLKMLFDEAIDTSGSNEAPKVQFKQGSSNTAWGAEQTATDKSATAYYSTSLTAGDNASTSDPIDFGTPPTGSGITREALGSGYVYKVNSAVDELYVRGTANFNTGVAFRARRAPTKPATNNLGSHGTLMWDSSSNGQIGNFAGGGVKVTSIPANTYLWFYPSAPKTAGARTLFIAGGPAGMDATSLGGITQSAGNTGGLSDPIDFDLSVGDSDYFTTESLGNSGGIVYKTTSHLSHLTITARGKFGTSTTLVGRWSTTKPTTTNMDENAGGTQMFSATSGVGNVIYGNHTLTDVAEGTYFWFYPSANNRTLSYRSLILTGVLGTADTPLYVASLTTSSSEAEVAAGSLKYDVTNETSVKDAAGNNLAAKAATVIAGYSFSKTLEATIASPSPSGKAKSKTIAITDVTDGVTGEYKLLTNATCNGTNYGAGTGTSVTFSSNAASVTVTNESDNSKYLCLKLTKTAHDTAYHGSTQITGIDDTAPTVTSGSTGYYETFTASTRTFGTAASGAYKATDDIYTKVTFSEDMTQTVGTGGTAKPVIKYSIAGAETQYEIVAQGTGSLDSGKCRPNHATETDEYVCRYTVASGNTGAFKVIVDTGSTDIATNALASKYTHATSLTLDTTVPTVGTNTITTSNSNSSYAKQSDTITITIDFSEEIDESNTTIKYQIGAGTETDFTYTTDATITSGKCKETTDTTDIYTCKYTVGASDNGLFKVKVSAFKDMAGNAGTAQTYNTSGVTTDTTAPTATYAITNTGGNSSNSKNYLNQSDTVSVTATFSESVNAAPTVQFINDSTDLGSAVTGVSDTGAAAEGSVYYASTPTGSDTGSATDALDFGDPGNSVAGLVRESALSGGGYVYKITRALPKVVIRASVTFDAGSALVARWSTTKPTSAQISGSGTQMWSSGSNSSESNYAIGTKVFTNVSAGTYFWIYPSAGANRVASNRTFLFAAGAAADDIITHDSGTLSSGDAGGTTDPLDFGAVSASGIDRESLGSGYVYKTTKPFAALYIKAAGNFGSGTALKARTAPTVPTTANLTTHGTEMWSADSNSSNSNYAAGRDILENIPTGTYFWFYPSATATLSNRVMLLDGVHAVAPTSKIVFDNTEASGDVSSTTDPLDFGTDSGADGITQETLGSGKVYKTTRAFTSLYIGAKGDMGTGAALKARWATTKPATTTLTSHGTDFWGVDSYGPNATAHGNGRLANVASGTYFWFYTSDVSNNRTVTNRELMVVEAVSAEQVLSYKSTALSANDAASTTDPIDFGAVSSVDGITQETLGSGKIYKTTKGFESFSIATKGTFSAAGNFVGRWATTAPTTANLTTHGTEMWSRAVIVSDTKSGIKMFDGEVASGTYFWFYPSVSMQVSNRVIDVAGIENITGGGTAYKATYTVGSGINVAGGNLKYDITNETSITDDAGNRLADHAATVITNYVIDTTAPVAPSTLDLKATSDTVSTSGSVTAGTTSDDITNDTTPTFTISGWTDGAAADTGTDSITLYLGSDSKGTSTGVTNNTAKDITASTTNAIANCAAQTFSAKTKDRAGNESATAATLAVTIKAASCIDKPTANDAIILNAGDDTGVSNTDQHTNDTTLRFDVDDAEAGGIATLVDGSTEQTSTAVKLDSNGDGTTTAYTIAEASNTSNTTITDYKMKIYDDAGNSVETTTAVVEDIYFDPGVAEPTIDLQAASDSANTTDNVTNDNTPTVDMGSLEIAATNFGDGAKVELYKWVDADTDNIVDASEVTGATNRVTSITSADAATKSHTFSTLSDDVYSYVVKTVDDAGNENWTGKGVTNSTNVLDMVIDTVKPKAPSEPDLKPADDTYGTNANYSRRGTDQDNITNDDSIQYFVDAADRQNGENSALSSTVDAHGTSPKTREQHHILFYNLVADDLTDYYASASPTTPAYTGSSWTSGITATAVSAVLDSAATNITTANTWGTTGTAETTSRTGEHFDVDFAQTDGLDTYRYVVAKQRDRAGNVSDYSSVLKVQVDEKAPAAVTTDLDLHPTSDTGVSGSDQQTSSVTPIFRTVSKSSSSDVDYYEMRRIRLNNQFQTVGSWEYPSSSTTAEQGSYNYVSGNTANDVNDTALPHSGYTGSYPDGVTVKIDAMTVPYYNTWYSFRVFTIDTAGNATSGVDKNNLKILVPPPKPTKPDLPSTDDTARDGYTAGASDDITSDIVWALTGSYTNAAGVEQTNDAAASVGSVVTKITSPDGVIKTVTRVRTTVSGTTQITPHDSDVNGNEESDTQNYTYTIPVDLVALFGAPNVVDGDWTITTQAVNYAGEAGNASDPLTVTLDRVAPLQQNANGLTLKVSQGAKVTTGDVEHSFSVPTAASEDNGAVYLYQDDAASAHFTGGVVVEGGAGVTANDTETAKFNANYTYHAVYADAAGNTTTKKVLTDSTLISSLPPKVNSFNLGSNKYLVVIAPRGTATITVDEMRQVTNSGSQACILGTAPVSTITSGSVYTNLAEMTITSSEEKCVGAQDSNGNATFVRARQDSTDLVTAVVFSEDTGHSDSDFITKDSTPKLTGVTIPNKKVVIEAKISTGSWTTPADVKATSATITSGITDGAIEYQLPSLADGSYDVRAFVLINDSDPTHTPKANGTGVALANSTKGYLVIDTTAHASPGTSLSMTTASDSGESSSDGITSETQPDFDMSVGYDVVLNETIELVNTGTNQILGSHTRTNTLTTGATYTFDSSDKLLAAFTDGTYTVALRVVDVAGNVSSNSNVVTAVIDTTAPDITLVRTAGADNAASTTGRKYIAAPADANGLANSNIQYKNISSSTTCNSTVTGLTTYSGEVTATTGNYCFKVTDKAGNISYALQTAAIQGVGNPAFDDGTSESGTYYVRSGSRTFTGVTANGATVKLYKAATGVTDYTTVTDRIGSDIVLAAGVNTISASISLPAGSYQLLGSIVPVGGSETPKVKLLNIETDNTVPTATLASIISSNSDTGFAKSGDTVTFTLTTSERLLLSGTTIAVSGKTASCTDVTGAVHENKVYTCTVSADNTMDEGTSAVAVNGKDYAGNPVFIRATSPSITIDSTAPSAAFTPSAHLVGAGKTATVGVAITDSNGIATTFPQTATVSGATPTSATLASATETLTLTAGSTQGPVTLDLPSFADNVGNTFDAPAETMFFVDTTAPSNLVVDSVKGGKKKVDITVTVDHSNPVSFAFGTQPVAEKVHLVFSGECATFGSSRDGVSGVQSTSDGRLTEQKHSFTLKAPKGTYDGCGVKIVDGAGNESAIVTISDSISVRSSGGGGGGGSVSRSIIASVSSIFGGAGTASDAGQQQNQSQNQQQQQQQGQQQQQTGTPLPTQTYTQGDRSAFIQKAQEFLNQTENCQVADTSHGSPGQETQYLGPATVQALQCFQAEQGLPVTGTLTPETYAALANVAAVSGSGTGSGTQQQQQGQEGQQQQQGQQTQEPAGSGTNLDDLHNKLAQLRQKLAGLLGGQNDGASNAGSGSQGSQSQGTQNQGSQGTQSQSQTQSQSGSQQSGQIGQTGQSEGQGQQNQQQQQIVYPGTEITGTHQNGSSSPEVKQAQVLLNRTACQISSAGSHHGSAGSETEYFGSKTETAIRCYQGLRGMTVDGILTPTLYATLVEEVGAAPAITVTVGSGSGSTTTTTTPPAGTQTSSQQQSQSGTQSQSQSGSQQSGQIGQIGQGQSGQQQTQQQQQQGQVNENNNDNSGYTQYTNPIYRSKTPANRGAPPAL